MIGKNFTITPSTLATSGFTNVGDSVTVVSNRVSLIVGRRGGRISMWVDSSKKHYYTVTNVKQSQ